MNNWKKVKLSDIIEFNPRETLSKGAIAKKIAMEKLEPFTRDIPEFEYLEFRGGTKFRNGDTLMARITPSLENGKTSKVNLLDEDEVGFGSTEFIVVRAKENISDENFVYYLMIAPNIREVAIKSMVGTSGRQRVQLDVVKNHKILCPPLKEQIRIGKILKALDDKIENNRKINHHLEEMATSIFENMFPNVSSGKSTIGNYIIPKRGKNLLSKDAIVGKVPVVAGGLQPSTFHNIANTKSPVLTISASGANAGYVNLWHIPVWSSDSSYIDTSITDNVYFWYVMLKKRQQEIYDSQTGSAQPHIYPKHIEIMPTIDLSEDKVSRFTKQVTPLFESIGNNIKEIGELQTLRDTLLPKLLSGEISVNQASK
ncbi:restriction endonuclease subunit S [Streptococcus constellatus]|uniref:restriction endonuclease subunit S n=1 Tax=Streptococcus constellatus TaxID=76860 RepID=UPI00200063F0|nr:restriction endonuclease subunit S [Streptococcus constellatus]